MAAASPSPLASSVEKTNGAKLNRLLIDGGTIVLRNVFDSYHPPANLASDLSANYLTLDNLLRRRVLRPAQWDQLFPPGGATPDSKTFDITLLFLLLTNICGRAPPLSGWYSKPPPADASFEANLARIRFFRNELYGHVTTTGVDTPTFNSLWQEISVVLVALGLNQAEIDRLEVEHCGEEDYVDLLRDWADSEADIKLQLRNMRHYQTETQQDLEKVLQIQLEDRNTLEESKSKLHQIHQTQTNIQETMKRVHQAQLDEQKTLEDSRTKLNDVYQAQTKTEQTVEKVRQTQVEDRGTLQYIKSTLDEVRQTQTNIEGTVKKESHTKLEDRGTLQALDELRQTQTKTQETVEAVEADLRQMKQVFGSLKEERKIESQADEVLRNLARSEFKGDIEYHVGRFQEGTREWVFKKALNWLDDRNSQNRVMVISANAGMGKSVISAVICKRMQEAGRLSGSHFCQHNNARYRNPQLMLQSLACHLCHALPEFKQALVEQLSRNLGKDLNNMGVEELFALLFKEPLSTVADPGRNMLTVIDGLDESEYQERNELLDVIANHFCKLPCWIRFLCTIRPEKNIVEALKQLKPFQLEPNEGDNVQDIKLFLEKRMQYLMKPESKGVIVEKLVEKSEGLMLYAYFLVSFIEENVSALNQGDLDGSLPLAISSVYHSYFKRLENELMKELGVKEENFLNLLCAVTASREPLPIDFVSKVLAPRANSLVGKRKVLKSIGSVSSLLPIRDGCLHVIHKSVKDWMTDALCYGEHDFIMDEKEGHRILANLCSDELDNMKQKGVHDTQFSPTLRYALQHGVRHMLQLEDCMTPSSSKLEKCVQRYVLDLEILYAKLCIDFPMAAEDILWLQRQEISQGLSEDSEVLLNILKISLRKRVITFTNYPHVFFQTMLNEGGTELSPVASNLLQNKYPEIPYMEFVHKQMQKGAVLARFQCSSLVACLDVSTQLDYMVCECIDGTIHLWSLHTGKLVWKRPVMVKKLNFGNGAYRVMQCLGANLLSCYRSVVFHPTADVVLPGVLSHAYTIDGDLTPLFPESKCSFTVCSISGDKTKMLTDCPDDAKCIIMWSLENGSEITRTTTNGDVLSFAWSQDGKLLAIAHSIDSIDFVVIDGNLLAVASSSGSISIVDAMDGFKTLDERETSELCGMIKFSPDCRSLLCYGHSFFAYGLVRRCICIFGLNIDMTEHPSCTLYYCDPDDRSWENWEIQSHSEAGYLLGDPISILEDGFDFVLLKETVLRGDFGDSSVDMLNISELRKTEKEAADINFRDIVLSLSDEIVYVVSDEAEPTVSAWHVSTGKLIAQKSSQTYNRNLTVAVKEGVLLTTETGTTLELWNFELSKCIRNWTNINVITKVIPVSEERVACEAENKVIILDTTSGEIVSTIPTSHGRLVTCNSKCQLLTYSSHSLQLSDGKATSWTIEISLHDIFGRPPVGMFSLSEQFVVIWAMGPLDCHKDVYVLDALSGKTVHIVYEIDFIDDCKFVSDEECVISCGAASRYCLRLFNVKSGDLLSVINLETEVKCLAACPRKRLLAIEQSDSKHGFELIQVHLPQDKDNKKRKWVPKTRNHTQVKVGKQEVCSCLDGVKKRNPWIIS